MHILIAQINPIIADLEGNTRKIVDSIERGRAQGADIVLFPELALTGYPPEDFLLLPSFLDAVEKHLETILPATKDITAIVGLPRRHHANGEKFLRNSAAVMSNGKLMGYQDKILLPTYDVFDEMRYFDSGDEAKVWDIAGQRVAITICEDIWQHSRLVMYTSYQRDPVNELKPLQPQLLLNLSASPYSLARTSQRVALCQNAAKTLGCPVILCNQVGGNDSLIFDGNSLYVDAEGNLCRQAASFAEDFALIDTKAKSTSKAPRLETESDLFHALVLGVRDYFSKQGFTKACIGLSGGIDSAVVAVIAAEALGPENILGVSMPSRYTAHMSQTDAETLARNLGIHYTEIPIEEPFKAYLHTLEPPFKDLQPDVTEENLQARIRGMILMALSNKQGYIVLATGNKSEMAMGYATLYGDMCGGLGVISDVPKMQVYALAHWINRTKEIIPSNTITRPPSAELRANQLDSDSLPPYEVVDTVLQEYVEHHIPPQEIAKRHNYPLNIVEDLVRRIHRNEYKRRQSAPGLRVSQRAFSVGRRFPIVQKWA